jgi:hypothetical protein
MGESASDFLKEFIERTLWNVPFRALVAQTAGRLVDLDGWSRGIAEGVVQFPELSGLAGPVALINRQGTLREPFGGDNRENGEGLCRSQPDLSFGR